jgi:hypothetical protein
MAQWELLSQVEGYSSIPLYIPSSSRSQQATVIVSDGMVFSRGSPWSCVRYLGFVYGVRRSEGEYVGCSGLYMVKCPFVVSSALVRYVLYVLGYSIWRGYS